MVITRTVMKSSSTLKDYMYYYLSNNTYENDNCFVLVSTLPISVWAIISCLFAYVLQINQN